MKLAALAVLLVPWVPTGVPVTFEADSVRVGDVAVTDLVMQLKETSSGFVLVSKDSVEPLAKPVMVSLALDHSIVLEPGVRVSRVQDGFALSVHNRRRVELEVAGEKTMLVVPVTLEITERGWKVAGKDFQTGQIAARRPEQDDVDQNLNQLGDSAKRILTPRSGDVRKQEPPGKANKGQGSKIRKRKPIPEYFSNGIFATSDAFDSNAVTALLHASPQGF
jgi:hypothetical protein